eukprot:TRINITY_DN61143_c0_g1_i1.p3 TRINITY_DN61143_c0_g1~~TRINITY_DN61143_c0_g1_i1.p3  ORF type:complete len:114 (+),score=19.32 TRINITY_DN61143_c0_g1_i1:136-477(+)
MQAPPTALILSSADLEKIFALTMTGTLGRIPLPSTLKQPYEFEPSAYGLGAIDNDGLGLVALLSNAFLGLSVGGLGDKSPELVEVDARSKDCVGLQMEMTDTELAEIARMAKR